jgi:hypothetical protein
LGLRVDLSVAELQNLENKGVEFAGVAARSRQAL